MKKIYSAVAAIVLCGGMYAQSPTLAWSKSLTIAQNSQVTASAAVKSIKADVDDCVYTAGYFLGSMDGFANDSLNPTTLISTPSINGNSTHDAFIIKQDNKGKLLWAKNFGGQGHDYVMDMALDATGNIYLTGYFSFTADFDPGAAKFELTPAGDQDIFIVKLLTNGDFAWAKRVGGTGNDQGNAIDVDINGNIYVGGNFENLVDFNPDSTVVNDYAAIAMGDPFILKLNAAGEFVFVKTFEGSNNDYLYTLDVDKQGNIFAGGLFFDAIDLDPGIATQSVSTNGNYDMYIVKLDNAGNFKWGKTFGGGITDYVNSLKADAAGNVYTTGYFAGSAAVNFGGTSFTPSSADADAFIAKYDTAGTLIWAKQIGDVGMDSGEDIVLDSDNNVFITGYFNETTDFNPGTGTASFTSIEQDAFIIKLDSAGDYKWGTALTGPKGQSGKTIAVDASDNIVFGCDFNTSIVINSTVHSATSIGNDVCMGKFQFNTPVNTGILDITENSLQVFPNPTNQKLRVVLKQDATVVITNAIGARVLNNSFSAGLQTLDVSTLSNGVYFIKAGNSAVTRFVKQ